MDTRLSSARLRIERLREALLDAGCDALLVPSSDPHLSEYLPERWQARQWASGFTGSVATLAITAREAALFADSRYWVQAERELAGSGLDLVKVATAAATHHIGWLCKRLDRGATVAVDGDVLSLAAARQLETELAACGIALRSDLDLVASAWPDRPEAPMAPVREHAAPEAAEPRSARLARIRAAMREAGATHHFVSTLDDIAWLLNLRGDDVGFNPVFLAHLLIDSDDATLFVDAAKIDAGLRAKLADDAVSLAPYDGAGAALAALGPDAALLIDPKRVTLGTSGRAANAKLVEAINPSTLAKSRKSEAEAAHVRQVMVQDGVAMAEFYAWFEAALASPSRAAPITELTIDEKLAAARARRLGHVGPSFATIAAFNANGAMPHYRATRASHAVIEGDGLLLIDSGAQYLGGTTDITRMWPVGTLGDAQKRDVTLVLRGTIALSRTRFPRGTLSPMLDAIARAPLWQHGLDYGHGTGHGVGYFLNVHEGPQSFSRVLPDASMAMQSGMITSVEPGLYRPGQWGVRVENLVLSVPATGSDVSAEFGEFLEFETLTLCPIDTRCLEPSLLRADEIEWLDAYHHMVRERLEPHLAEPALDWLLRRTRPLA